MSIHDKRQKILIKILTNFVKNSQNDKYSSQFGLVIQILYLIIESKNLYKKTKNGKISFEFPPRKKRARKGSTETSQAE